MSCQPNTSQVDRDVLDDGAMLAVGDLLGVDGAHHYEELVRS
jgi:hypothetical protein